MFQFSFIFAPGEGTTYGVLYVYLEGRDILGPAGRTVARVIGHRNDFRSVPCIDVRSNNVSDRFTL